MQDVKNSIVVGAVCLSLGWCSAGLCGSAKIPNIVLVMSDDQGWGQVGYNGHPYLKTLHLDDMAASGICFDRFYIPFTMKETALIDGKFKLLSAERGKHAKWVLHDLEQDPGETQDVSGEHPERFERMKAQAAKLVASVEASAEGKDYPEGRVIQPQRGERWYAMEAYQQLYPTFQKLKPEWTPPSEGKGKRSKNSGEEK